MNSSRIEAASDHPGAKTRTLGEMCSIWGGHTPSKSRPDYWGGDIPWLSSKDIKAFEIATGTEFVTRRGLDETGLRVASRGSIVVVMRSGVLAHTFPVGIIEQGVTINQDLKILDSGNPVTNRFLAWFLMSKESEILSENRRDGTTVQSIQLPLLKNLEVPVLTLDRQKSIVDSIEQAVSSVHAVADRLATIPTLLKKFRQSVLAAACSGQLTADWRATHPECTNTSIISETNARWKLSRTRLKSDAVTQDVSELPEIPDGWCFVACRQLTNPERALTYGVIKLGEPDDTGIPCLRSSDVKKLYISEYRIKKISAKIEREFKRTSLVGGEVVVTVRGTLGGVAVVPKNMAGFNVSREVAVVPISASMQPQFVALAIASEPLNKWLREVAKGVAYTGINIEDLCRLPIPVPSLEEQNEIVRRVESLFALADSIESRLTDATRQLERTTQAILSKAFRGEL